METTDTIGRGWYGVIIVPKKQKDESFHDEAMRKAAKIIVQTRPDLAIGDFGKPVRERDHKVAFALDSSGNIVVPKKRKNETRGDKAARKAAEMAVNMQMANTTRIRDDAANSDSRVHGEVGLAGGNTGSMVVSKKRKGEIPKERAVRKAAKSASGSSMSKTCAVEEQGRKSKWESLTAEQKKAQIEAQRGILQNVRPAGKELEGAWDSPAFVSKRYGALPAVQFAGHRALRPSKESMEQKCRDCGVIDYATYLYGRTSDGTWILVCHLCYNTRYSKRWRNAQAESRRQLAAKSRPAMIDEQPQRVSTGRGDEAQIYEARAR